MLKPRKRLTKRQIKEDKLVTYYFKTIEYVTQNIRFIAIVSGALVVIAVVAFLYANSVRGKEEAASVEFTKADLQYQNGNYQAAIDQFKRLIEDYGGTDKAELGKYYIANSYYKIGNYADAETYFREYLDSNGDSFLASSAMAGVAACLEQQGKYQEAAEQYEKTARQYKGGVLAPQNLYNAARNYDLAGNKQAAIGALQNLIKEYPDSGVKNDAEIMLAELQS